MAFILNAAWVRTFSTGVRRVRRQWLRQSRPDEWGRASQTGRARRVWKTAHRIVMACACIWRTLEGEHSKLLTVWIATYLSITSTLWDLYFTLWGQEPHVAMNAMLGRIPTYLVRVCTRRIFGIFGSEATACDRNVQMAPYLHIEAWAKPLSVYCRGWLGPVIRLWRKVWCLTALSLIDVLAS